MNFNWRSIGGRDLSASFYCTCPDKNYVGTPIETVMKTKIELSGYNDRYFWDEVNKEPREVECECGKKYTQQWKENGIVEVNEQL